MVMRYISTGRHVILQGRFNNVRIRNTATCRFVEATGRKFGCKRLQIFLQPLVISDRCGMRFFVMIIDACLYPLGEGRLTCFGNGGRNVIAVMYATKKWAHRQKVRPL